MAVLTATNLTLADWAKRLDPDGQTSTIGELLTMTNEILMDCVWKEGNLPTGERVTVRTGLPEVYWRSLNQGIPNSKSTTAQVDEACAMLEARSEMDVKLAQLNGNTGAFRASEDLAFIEGMNQRMATTMIYGNAAVDPKTFTGLAPRYSSLGAGNAQNIISALGNTPNAQTSIYLVGWGDSTVYGIFPKGSMAGLDRKDLGEQTAYYSDGTRMQVYASLYSWTPGLVVKDWRYVVRIPNIQVTDLQALGATQQPGPNGSIYGNILHRMAQALYRIPQLRRCRPAFYLNRTVHSALTRLAMEKSTSVLNIQDGLSQFGTPAAYTTFMGVPLRLVDSILNTEAVVS
jgi:hypothetical protein